MMSIAIEHPEFVPDASMDRAEMEQLQREIGETAVFEDDFSFNPYLEEAVVVGVDQAFLDDQVISGVVAIKNGVVIEKAHAVRETPFPYIPGLLSFREGNAILAALKELDITPDVLVMDGSGRIHYREAGIATHIGVTTDVPSIGVAKNLLCGEPEHSLPEKMGQGKRVTVLADDAVETAGAGAVIGYAFQSKQYPGNRKVNPLYVSPGHRIGAKTAVDVVERLGGEEREYKLPEPTRLADKYVADVKHAECNMA